MHAVRYLKSALTQHLKYKKCAKEILAYHVNKKNFQND